MSYGEHRLNRVGARSVGPGSGRASRPIRRGEPLVAEIQKAERDVSSRREPMLIAFEQRGRIEFCQAAALVQIRAPPKANAAGILRDTVPRVAKRGIYERADRIVRLPSTRYRPLPSCGDSQERLEGGRHRFRAQDAGSQ
jgi:hypothetical protein